MLGDDVKRLGRLLGETLETHGGRALFEKVESLRVLARDLRQKDASIAPLDAALRSLSIDEAAFVARAFAHFLNLSNLAEQRDRLRRQEARKKESTLDQTFSRLLAGGVDKDRLHAAVCAQSVELVLTAHPTEVARRTVRKKQARVVMLLDDEDDEVLRREVEGLWLTDEIRRKKPTPEDEARGGWVAVEQAMWRAVPDFHRALDLALKKHTGRGLPLDVVPLRFCSWMGGDRDGNPAVTAKVTLRVAALGRWLAADLFEHDVEFLRDDLTMTTGPVRDVREPYRAVLKELRDRLRAEKEALEAFLEGAPLPKLLTRAELLAPLLACDDSLRKTGAARIADGALRDTIVRAHAFGVALTPLDLRQESPKHSEYLDEITGGKYTTWDEAERQRWLLAELEKPPRTDLPRSEVGDTFAALKALGKESINAYVISMTRAASDVLAVAFFQREVRIVPLFETIDDLAAAQSTLQALFEMPWYRKHCGGAQEVMVGYSDSTKDRGRLTAAWTLYEAQERIAELCAKEDIALTIFHGRGGSVGRGGGSTSLAIAAQPPGTLAGRLRVTEQGEMIQTKLGLPGLAYRTFELYTTATLTGTLRPPAPPEPPWRTAMARMSERAAAVYEKWVKHTPEFLAYFREATPIEELSALNIGSRPARRGGITGVSSLRAIPWMFAWTQTRFHVPSWLGVGEALREEDTAVLRAMYERWQFFAATMDLIAMVLEKSEPRLAQHIDETLVPKERQDIGRQLRQSLALAKEQVLRASGKDTLIAESSALGRSIAARNPYVDPLNLLQAEFLRRLRAGDETPALRDALLITMNGIANGMRNTG